MARIEASFVDACRREFPREHGRPWTANGCAWALAYALRAAGIAGAAGRDRPAPRPGATPAPSRTRIVELAGLGYDAEQIAATLDSEGVPTPRGGPHWSPATVDYQVSLALGRWLPRWR